MTDCTVVLNILKFVVVCVSVCSLDTLLEEGLVLLQLGAGGEIDVVHLGVLVANADNETANEVGVHVSLDL